MKKVQLNEKKLSAINDVGGCSNFGGLVLNGDTMYTIKTKGDESMSAISVYPDYRKSKRKSYKFANCMHHGNDIAYHDGNLYVATCANYVQVVNTQFWSHTRLDADMRVLSISHYKDDIFVVLSEKGDTYYTLNLVRPEGTQLKLIRSWNVNNPYAKYGYTVTQSVELKKSSGQIYVVISNKHYKSNIILRSKIDQTSPNCCFVSKKSTGGLYEFEGLSFNKTGSMVIGVNLPSSKDAIFLAR